MTGLEIKPGTPASSSATSPITHCIQIYVYSDNYSPKGIMRGNMGIIGGTPVGRLPIPAGRPVAAVVDVDTDGGVKVEETLPVEVVVCDTGVLFPVNDTINYIVLCFLLPMF